LKPEKIKILLNKGINIWIKIQEALNQAYAGESKAALRLKVYAQKAEDEGYNQMARLFRVISFFGRNSRRESLKGAPGNQGNGRKSGRQF